MKTKYIFLDIDGVLNHQSFYTWRYSFVKSHEYVVKYPYSEFSPESVKWLNKLTDESNAKIVIT
jgi:histidinol phosphatase-like enzyme